MDFSHKAYVVSHVQYQAQCSCGARSDLVDSRKAAEALAIRHEAEKIRRPHQHDSNAVEVTR